MLFLVVAMAALPVASASATTLPAPFAPACPADSPGLFCAREWPTSASATSTGQRGSSRFRYGNHWRLEPGHRIRLDLTQVDSPTYRKSNIPSSFQFPSGVTLVLPTR